MVLHDLHDISAFRYYGSQIVVVVERECSKPAENHQTLIANRLQETLVLAQNTQNNEKIKIFWKSSLLTLTNDLFVIKRLSCIILHICTEKEVSAIPLTIGWPLTFCRKEQCAPSFYRSRFKYGVRSLNTQHFLSYCSCKNVLFMGQSDLDPWITDLYVYLNVAFLFETCTNTSRLHR